MQKFIYKTMVVYGRVQGVGFRYHVLKSAEKIGILGNVKNQADGSVAISFFGNLPAVNEFIEECRKGPTASLVEHHTLKDCPTFTANDFKILR